MAYPLTLLIIEFVRESLECGERILYSCSVYAIGDTNIAENAEIVTRHYEYFLFLRLLAEFIRIILKCLYEEIKSSVGFYALVSVFGQAVVEQITVFTIDLQIDLGVNATLNDLLEQAGRANVAKRATCAAHGKINACGILHGG